MDENNPLHDMDIILEDTASLVVVYLIQAANRIDLD